jgi:hypothetical protein
MAALNHLVDTRPKAPTLLAWGTATGPVAQELPVQELLQFVVVP